MMPFSGPHPNRRFALLIAVVCTAVAVAAWWQQRVYQRVLDAAIMRTLTAVEERMERAIVERAQLEAEIRRLRETTEPLKGLAKGVEALKEAVKEIDK
jgi:sensor domain CHASE-containing protein